MKCTQDRAIDSTVIAQVIKKCACVCFAVILQVTVFEYHRPSQLLKQK